MKACLNLSACLWAKQKTGCQIFLADTPLADSAAKTLWITLAYIWHNPHRHQTDLHTIPEYALNCVAMTYRCLYSALRYSACYHDTDRQRLFRSIEGRVWRSVSGPRHWSNIFKSLQMNVSLLYMLDPRAPYVESIDFVWLSTQNSTSANCWQILAVRTVARSSVSSQRSNGTAKRKHHISDTGGPNRKQASRMSSPNPTRYVCFLYAPFHFLVTYDVYIYIYMIMIIKI